MSIHRVKLFSKGIHPIMTLGSTHPATPSSSSAELVAQPVRLDFIEGLRGVAASIVMLGHAIRMVPHTVSNWPLGTFGNATLLERWIWPLLFGEPMVALFIFISGFSLYYSEMRRRQTKGPTSIREFARRRAWRILPTYYVALAISLAIVLLVPAPPPYGNSLDTVRLVTPGTFWSHLFLFHNLNPDWIHRISPPLWSIATEAQLYILFPALVFLFQRINPLYIVLLVFALKKAANLMGPAGLLAFLTFFAGGILCAHLALFKPMKSAAPAVAMALVGFAGGFWIGPDTIGISYEAKLVWIVAFFGLCTWLYQRPHQHWNIFAWTPFRKLGTISYSLYAIHFPVLYLLFWPIARVDWTQSVKLGYMLGVGTIGSLLVAWGLYATVERWSLKRMSSGVRSS